MLKVLGLCAVHVSRARPRFWTSLGLAGCITLGESHNCSWFLLQKTRHLPESVCVGVWVCLPRIKNVSQRGLFFSQRRPRLWAARGSQGTGPVSRPLSHGANNAKGSGLQREERKGAGKTRAHLRWTSRCSSTQHHTCRSRTTGRRRPGRRLGHPLPCSWPPLLT